MSQSESLKADKDLMWKKLSTLPGFSWQQTLGRGLRKGELNVMAAGRQTGKSMLSTKMWELLSETHDDRIKRIAWEPHARILAILDEASGHTDE